MSYVIIKIETGEAILEIYDKKVADAVNREKYQVVPIAQYLGELNEKIKNQRFTDET